MDIAPRADVTCACTCEGVAREGERYLCAECFCIISCLKKVMGEVYVISQMTKQNFLKIEKYRHIHNSLQNVLLVETVVLEVLIFK